MTNFPSKEDLEESDRAAREAQEILDHKALRDRFAIAALPPILEKVHVDPRIPPERAPEVAARSAYVVADAMLKERDR